MRFIFSRRFYILFAIGLVPLSLSWRLPALQYIVLGFDVLLLGLAIIDYFISVVVAEGLTVTRNFDRRFAIGDETEVILSIENELERALHVRIKDEYPAELILTETREASFTVPGRSNAEFFYRVKPQRRGRYEFGKTAVRYLSRFGLVWCQAELGLAQ